MSLSGLIAIVGSLAGTVLTYKLTTSHDKHTMRLHKLESLMALTYELEQWLARERSAALAREGTSAIPGTINTIHVIVHMYFPEMQQEVRELSEAAHCYNVWRNTLEEQRAAQHHTTPLPPRGPEEYREQQQRLLLRMLDITDALSGKSARTMKSMLKHV